MPDYDKIAHVAAVVEKAELAKEKVVEKSWKDYLALSVATFGVGYLPLAPGTWGSMVGVAIYLLLGWLKANLAADAGAKGATEAQIAAWVHATNLIVFLLFCLLGIWAAGRATKIFRHKDPSQAVIDEVIGQLITFLFIPFTFSWKLILAGFLLFRLFDIWKPYPINSLQNLPAGVGVCADDILAGVYAGTALSLLYAIGLTI